MEGEEEDLRPAEGTKGPPEGTKGALRVVPTSPTAEQDSEKGELWKSLTSPRISELRNLTPEEAKKRLKDVSITPSHQPATQAHRHTQRTHTHRQTHVYRHIVGSVAIFLSLATFAGSLVTIVLFWQVFLNAINERARMQWDNVSLGSNDRCLT